MNRNSYKFKIDDIVQIQGGTFILWNGYASYVSTKSNLIVKLLEVRKLSGSANGRVLYGDGVVPVGNKVSFMLNEFISFPENVPPKLRIPDEANLPNI